MSNSPADFGDHPHDSDPDSPRPDPGLHHGGSPDRWRNVFDEAEVGLRRFLAAKLPQAADVDDCLQSVLMAMKKNNKET